jgi:hypothetical protein
LALDLTKQGSLEGILLTGLTTSAVDVFEQYINIVGDVQTASLVLSHVVPKKFKDSRVENWVKMLSFIFICYLIILIDIVNY